MSEFALEIFISHSSEDADLAKALIELLRMALVIPANGIRCTSIDGYRLPVGTDSDIAIRQEVCSARCFVGLITPASWASAYVLFELGARWGAGLPLFPLLAGVVPSKLGGPLRGLNALNLTEEGQVDQLLEDIGRLLKQNLEPTSSFRSKLSELVLLAQNRKSVPDKREIPKSGIEGPYPPFGYFYKNGDRENPLCPKCIQGNPPKEGFFTPLEEWNRGLRRKCRLCGHFIYEKEMNTSPRPASQRRPYSPWS